MILHDVSRYAMEQRISFASTGIENWSRTRSNSGYLHCRSRSNHNWYAYGSSSSSGSSSGSSPDPGRLVRHLVSQHTRMLRSA
jgi:hypothetical protein